MTTTRSGALRIPPGTDVEVSIGTGATWWFTVSDAPTVGIDLFRLRDVGHFNNLAITPFRQFDVLFDYRAGVIALAPKL